MSRAQLCRALVDAQQLSVDLAYKNSMLVHDLRLACLHGLWRRDHPLAAHRQQGEAHQKLLSLHREKRVVDMQPVKLLLNQT